jgi:hypothetical protein
MFLNIYSPFKNAGLLKILLAGFNRHLEVLMRKKAGSITFRPQFGNNLVFI